METLSLFYEIGRKAVIWIVALLLIILFVCTVYRVDGPSMSPTLVNGQILLIQKIGYWWRQPERGEVVVVRFPGDPDRSLYVKRIIGLPGETIHISTQSIDIDGKPLSEPYLAQLGHNGRELTTTLGPNQYWLMGDNRAISNDSRSFGSVERRFIVGSVLYSLWPFQSISSLISTY